MNKTAGRIKDESIQDKICSYTTAIHQQLPFFNVKQRHTF